MTFPLTTHPLFGIVAVHEDKHQEDDASMDRRPLGVT